MITVRFTTAGSKVVRDIYYNDFFFFYCASVKGTSSHGDGRPTIFVSPRNMLSHGGLTEISGRTVPRPLTRLQEFLIF